MQEHLANRAKTEGRLTWFLRRTENTAHWTDSMSVFIFICCFYLTFLFKMPKNNVMTSN